MEEDMLVEILTKLPLKSFTTSKCVSKSWYNLISDDYVRSKLPMIVAGISNKNLKYVSTAESTDLTPTELTFLPFRSSSTLIDSCNGILLFHSSLTSSFHVCNPITKGHATLPKPPSDNTHLFSVLAFDPSCSRHYRVVSFIEWLPKGARIEVFDSESNKWTKHIINWELGTVSLLPTMRCVDCKVLYILVRCKEMVVMNIESMTCEVVELPEAAGVGSCVGKLGGRLCYSVNEGKELRVWVLRGRSG